MLCLNPNDNQGARDTRTGWLQAEERDEELVRRFDQSDEETTHSAHSKSLVASQQHGGTPESRRLLQRAHKANQHVPACLLGQRPLSLERPAWCSPGGRIAAILYAGSSLSGWKETPGATAWLKATDQGTKRSKAPNPLTQGRTSHSAEFENPCDEAAMPPRKLARLVLIFGLAVGVGLLARSWVAKPEPIKVGILHSRTGTMAMSEEPVVEATLLAIDEINAKGGLLGRPIVALIADGKSDWPTFASEAERLITEDKVCTVFGCWTSASRKTVLPVFERHNHLLLYPVQYEGLETSPNIVYLGAAPNQQIIPATSWCFTYLKKKRFFLVGSDYVFPHTANAIIKHQLKALGGQTVDEQYLLLGSSDVRAVIERIVATPAGHDSQHDQRRQQLGLLPRTAPGWHHVGPDSDHVVQPCRARAAEHERPRCDR